MAIDPVGGALNDTGAGAIGGANFADAVTKASQGNLGAQNSNAPFDPGNLPPQAEGNGHAFGRDDDDDRAKFDPDDKQNTSRGVAGDDDDDRFGLDDDDRQNTSRGVIGDDDNADVDDRDDDDDRFELDDDDDRQNTSRGVSQGSDDADDERPVARLSQGGADTSAQIRNAPASFGRGDDFRHNPRLDKDFAQVWAQPLPGGGQDGRAAPFRGPTDLVLTVISHGPPHGPRHDALYSAFNQGQGRAGGIPLPFQGQWQIGGIGQTGSSTRGGGASLGQSYIDFHPSMLPNGHWGKPPGDAGSGWRSLSAGHYIPTVSMLDASFHVIPAVGLMAGLQKMSGEAKDLFIRLIREARTPDEIYLINLMRTQGRSPEQAYRALIAMRQWQAMQAAAQPGTAFTSGIARDYAGPWLGGQQGGNIGLIPAQISSKLEGRTFENFANFTQEFWKAAATTPELASQFSAANLARMQAGLPPIAPVSQQFGEFSAYMIVHRVSVSSGGAVFDMSNMAIVTPLMHQAIMDPRYHPFMSNILHSGHMSVRVAVRRRRKRRSKDRVTLTDWGFGSWARKKWRAFMRKRKRQFQKGEKRPHRPVLVGEILPPLRRRQVRQGGPAELTLTAMPLAIA